MEKNNIGSQLETALESRLENISPDHRKAFKEAIPGLVSDIRRRIVVNLEYNPAYQFNANEEAETSAKDWLKNAEAASL